MSTRLHALGFAAQWTPEVMAQIEGIASERSRLVGSAKGNYRLWRSQQGAELWFHYPAPAASAVGGLRPTSARRNGTRIVTGAVVAGTDAPAPCAVPRPVAVTPFHRGLSSCPIRIGRYLALDRSNPLEGSCMAWLPAPASGGKEQVIVVELAPFGLHVRRTPPYATTAQIVCFAHALWAYADPAAYARETPSNRRIHAGAISPVTEADVPEVAVSYRSSPITLALATGTVRRAIRHVNPETREPYYWLLLETRRGTIDVVANPTHMQGDVSEGHVVQVCGSLLARLEGTPA